jgi:hypothetical protein
MKCKSFGLLLLFMIFSFTTSASTFTGVEGVVMVDTNGVPIQAHGGQIQKLGDKYYWIGEDKTYDYKPCPGIHMYTSEDLYNWKDEGLVLKTMKSQSDFNNEYFAALYGGLSEQEKYKIYEDLWMGQGGEGCVIERPKMLRSPKTGKYVIWFHADGTTPSSAGGNNYGKAKAGIAISDNALGPYKFLGSYLLINNNKYDHSWDNIGGHVRDMNLFQDDDGTAYVIYSSDGNANTYIAKLNEEYTGLAKSGNEPVEGVDYIVTFLKNSREAPAMFKANGKYYMITSGCTGWSPNPASYAIADKVLGEWKTIGNPCVDNGSGTTYDTQSTCVYKVNEGEYIYMGDRWFSDKLRDSRYVWLPIEFDSQGHISLKRYSNWDLNIFKNIKSFTIKTKLPTQVDSVSALKTSLPSTLEIQFTGESKTEEVKVEWNLEINENLIADISVTGKLSIGRSIVHNVNILDKRIIYFFDCAAESFGAGQYYTLLKNALGKKLENAKADQKYIKGTQAGYSSTLGGDNDNVDITIKNGGGNDIWSHGYWAHGGRSIDYSFDLSEGTYHVNEGFYEWWNTQRNMVISVTANGAQIAGGTFTLGRADTRNQQSVKFTLSSRQTVTVSVKKASGPDPVLSWISILKDN